MLPVRWLWRVEVNLVGSQVGRVLSPSEERTRYWQTDMSEKRCGGTETGNDVRVFVCSGTSTLHPWQSDPSIKPFTPVHPSPFLTGASRVTRSSSRKALEPRSDRVGTRPVGSESRLVHHDSFGPRVWALVREDSGLLRSTMLACGRRDTHSARQTRDPIASNRIDPRRSLFRAVPSPVQRVSATIRGCGSCILRLRNSIPIHRSTWSWHFQFSALYDLDLCSFPASLVPTGNL